MSLEANCRRTSGSCRTRSKLARSALKPFAGDHRSGGARIPKPGTTETRPLGIPTVRDRVVQAAVVNVIEPIFERCPKAQHRAEQSDGFRPGRGCKDALRRVDELLKAGYVHVVDADLKGDFDSIPHGPLMDRLRSKIADGQHGWMEAAGSLVVRCPSVERRRAFPPPAAVLSLIEAFLTAGILDDTTEWTPTTGAPQGAVLSPDHRSGGALSNIDLDPLDHLMVRCGCEMVRYADDFVILCRTADAAARALERVREWVADNGLTLHPTKTRIVDSRTDSFAFLGYEFRGEKHWPRKKSLGKLQDALRAKTRRTSGQSLPSIVSDVNRTLCGWFEYFRHSSYRNVFTDLDGWLRGRLRSILRKRLGLKGRGRGRDHQRWPNAYFTAHGLFCLTAAHVAVCQSSRR